MDEELVILDEKEIIEKVKELYKTEFIANGKGDIGYDSFAFAIADYLLNN